MSSGSIKNRIMAAGILVLVLGLASSGTGLFVISRLNRGVTESSTAASVLRNHMQADMMHDALRSDVLAAILSSDPANGVSLEEVKSDLEGHAATFEAAIQENEKLATDPESRAVLKALEEPLAAYLQSARAIIEVAGSDPVAAKTQLTAFKHSFEVLETSMAEAGDRVEKNAQTATRASELVGMSGRAIMLAGLVLGTLFAIGLIMAARRTIIDPIIDVTRATTRLSEGDLSVVPPHGDRKDEIGAMARALHAFKEAMAGRQSEAEAEEQRRQLDAERRHAEELQRQVTEEQQMVMVAVSAAMERLAAGDLTYRFDRPLPASYRKLQDDFNQAISQLEDTLTVILDHAEGIRTGAGEISHASDDLARRTERQAATLEETAAAVEEITVTVRKAADGAKLANTTVAETKEDAERGGAVAEQAISAMSEIETSSSQIGKIIGVIDEIAFQTNLLALNAGVEAARAGEAGKGFAVVASEVRALAQRSADAAKEIKDLVEISGRNVATGVDLVGQTGQALGLIVAKVADINTLVHQISASSQDQASALGEVNLAVAEMDQVTQQNAAMVEQSTAASHSLARDATELSQLVGRFRISRQIGRRAA